MKNSESEFHNENEQNHVIFTKTRCISENTSSGNNLIKIKSKSAMFKCPAFYKKALFLSFSFILIMALIVFVFLYTTQKRRLHETCLSNECLKSSANLKLSMDTSIDPCDDFYEYACGHWSEEHLKFSNFETIAETVYLAALKFLQKNSTPLDPLPIRQSRELYQSCMDIDARNSLGFSSIKKYLNESNLPNIPRYFYLMQNQNSSKNYNETYEFDWIKADVAIKKLFTLDIFVGVSVKTDFNNPGRNVINFGLPDLRSPFSILPILNPYYSEFVNTEDEYSNEGTKWKNIVKYVVRSIITNSSLVLNDSELEQATDTILNLIKEVDQTTIFLPSPNFYDETYNVDSIQKITDEYLKANNESSFEIWRPYLNLLFENSTVALDLDKTDVVYLSGRNVMEYLKRIALYLAQKPDIYVELYMWWIVVRTMIMHTTTNVSTYILGQHSYRFAPKIANDRQRYCVSMTINFMETAVLYGITDRTFLRKTKPKIEQMLFELKQAFQERLNEIDWMDKNTKRETLKKCEEMVSFIGFPPWLFKRGAIESYYYGVKTDRYKYLENLVGIIKLHVPYQLKSLRRKNLKIWPGAIFAVNAFNYFTINSIDVPLPMLTFPFYRLGLQSLEYGVIGTILGHEVTHGFDVTGRQFDRYGNYKQWWSGETIQAFDEKTKCFIEQYDKFYFPEIREYVKGTQTLTESLADSGGLHLSFRAYKNHLKKYGREQKLPGFENYTDEQMFFVAYGNIWCENLTPDMLKKQIFENGHAPNLARALINLQNSEDFAQAFKCPVGSKMNPSNSKCRIW